VSERSERDAPRLVPRSDKLDGRDARRLDLRAVGAQGSALGGRESVTREGTHGVQVLVLGLDDGERHGEGLRRRRRGGGEGSASAASGPARSAPSSRCPSPLCLAPTRPRSSGSRARYPPPPSPELARPRRPLPRRQPALSSPGPDSPPRLRARTPTSRRGTRAARGGASHATWPTSVRRRGSRRTGARRTRCVGG